MPDNDRFLPDTSAAEVAAIAATRVARLRERFPERYDEAQWRRISRSAEESVRRGCSLRRFGLANHDEPDPRFVAWRADGERS